MYYQETPKQPDVKIVLDDLVYLGQGDDLFDCSKNYYDSVSIWRSEFAPESQTTLFDLEMTIEDYIRRLGPSYMVEQMDGSDWLFEPRSDIIQGTSIKTYGLDAPVVAGASETDSLYLRKCRIKAWLQHRKDGKLNLALDYIDFYPEEEREEMPVYVPVPGEIEF